MRAEPDLSPVALGPINGHGKRRQYVPAPVIPLAAPPVPVPAAGVCPGGPSLPVECDPKRYLVVSCYFDVLFLDHGRNARLNPIVTQPTVSILVLTSAVQFVSYERWVSKQ